MTEVQFPPMTNIMHRHVGNSRVTAAEVGLGPDTPVYEIQELDYSKKTTPESPVDDKFDSASVKEKGAYETHAVDVDEFDWKDYKPGDPFPMEPSYVPETLSQQITLRAILVGCCVGGLVQASNIYLGLKTGFTFGVSLVGGVGGFMILRPLSRVIPQWMPSWVGVGHFGPRENVACQSAATAAGGLGILFVSGFPALYQLGCLSPNPSSDVGKLIAFTLCLAFYGQAFAIPLRKFFILKQRLVFPTPTATAIAIRGLHDVRNTAESLRQKTRWLCYPFLGAITQKIASTWVPGILYDWHVGYWIADWGGRSMQALDNWLFWFELTPAFFGAGMLAGVNASYSFYGGSILAWGIIGPSLVATGRAAVHHIDISPLDPHGIDYYTVIRMVCADPTGTGCSPRYNLLWPGILILLTAAFMEVAVLYPMFWKAMRPTVYQCVNYYRRKRGSDKPQLFAEEMTLIPEVAEPHEQVPWFMWTSLLATSFLLSMIIMPVVFKLNAGLVFLSTILGFIFAFAGVLSAGTTDWNPVTSCAKANQLITGGISRGWYPSQLDPTTGLNTSLLRLNLMSGLIAAGAAGQASDMTGDLKTGHLLRAAPVAQFVAQACGAFCSIFLCVGFFLLFTEAAPCILDADAESCPYGIPSASAWRAVAIGVTTAKFPVPITSGIIALIMMAVTILTVLFRQYICPERYRKYVPSPIAVGMAFVLQATQYGLAMVIGSTFAWWWQRRNLKHYEAVAYCCAAGLIAGEGLGGVVQAVLIIAGATGGTDQSYVSTAGCPQTGC